MTSVLNSKFEQEIDSKEVYLIVLGPVKDYENDRIEIEFRTDGGKAIKFDERSMTI